MSRFKVFQNFYFNIYNELKITVLAVTAVETRMVIGFQP